MKRAQRTTQASASAMQKSMGTIAAGIKGLVAGLSVGLIIQAGKAALEYAGHLGELADTLGLTTKDLQTFSYAAGQVGISQEELEAGIQKLTISMGKAQLGSKAQVAAFDAIGISLDQLKGKDAGEVFRLIADKLQNVSDRSQRAAVEVALFGKAGAKLDNLLSGSQGRLSELSDAAERLGIVLSDEQIQKADATADKIAALQTVLKANIAGAVADNADSILSLANALATLISSVGQAITGWKRMVAEFKAGMPFLAQGPAGLGLYSQAADLAAKDQKNASTFAKIQSGLSNFGKKPKPVGGAAPKAFLGGGGGGGSKRSRGGGADHSAQDSLRDANQFDQELRRAQMDVLQATQDLSHDYVERTTLGIQMLDLEKAGFDSEQRYQTALFKLTKGKEGQSDAQAAQLKIEFDKADQLRRQALLDEEQAQRRQDVAMLDQTNFDTQKDKLQSELQLATTAKEQRDIQLKLLDLSYAQEKARLEAVLADQQASEAAKEDARRRIAALSHTYGNDRQGVINNTMGPLESYLNGIPHTVEQTQEALENLEVQGLDGLATALSHVGEGWKAMRDIALHTIQDILAALIKMQVQKMIFSMLSSVAGGGIGAPNLGSAAAVNVGSSALSYGGPSLGTLAAGLPGFASGGSGVFGGIAGTDKNILSMNGLPIAKVSRGEKFAFGNDNRPHMGAVHIHMSGPMTDMQARRTGMQAAAGYNAEMARSRSKGIAG
jgi:hypothetical protein